MESPAPDAVEFTSVDYPHLTVWFPATWEAAEDEEGTLEIFRPSDDTGTFRLSMMQIQRKGEPVADPANVYLRAQAQDDSYETVSDDPLIIAQPVKQLEEDGIAFLHHTWLTGQGLNLLICTYSEPLSYTDTDQAEQDYALVQLILRNIEYKPAANQAA